MGKTVLILGNGFDLAHGLPTAYSDFLEFSKRVLAIYSQKKDEKTKALLLYRTNQLDNWSVNSMKKDAIEYLKNRLEKLFDERQFDYCIDGDPPSIEQVIVNKRLDCYAEWLKNNIWYTYFTRIYDKSIILGNKWIDFEQEISYIIQIIDARHHSLTEPYSHIHQWMINGQVDDQRYLMFGNSCTRCCGQVNIHKLSVKEMRDRLYDDLEKMIRAFGIYLTDFVEQIPIRRKINCLEKIEPDYVISFNYTKTYKTVYNPNVPICYIHGQCIFGEEMANNMVLGIDKYSIDSLSECKEDFSLFKKFVQRIRKHNDVSYAGWAEEIERISNNNRPIIEDVGDRMIVHGKDKLLSDVYIFGHSLGITDSDILQRFLKSDASKVHIFAKDEKSEVDLISNLLDIIGEETVVRKSTQNPVMLEILRSE